MLSACIVLSAVLDPVNASDSYRRRLLSSSEPDGSHMQLQEQLSGPHRAKLQASQQSATASLQLRIHAVMICRESISRCIA